MEKKIIEMQKHPTDDNPVAVCNVMAPMVDALQREEGAGFYEPMTADEAFHEVVFRETSLGKIFRALQEHEYLNRFDFEADILMLFDDAILFSGPQSMRGVACAHAKARTVQFLAKSMPSVDRN